MTQANFQLVWNFISAYVIPFMTYLIPAMIAASTVTGLTNKPTGKGFVAGLQTVLRLLSYLTHKDEPGTFTTPLVTK